ncbi:MAG: hypothetical protein M3N68_07400 [Actinomycetota bacterium]|nr:hypothetical protein [Actinomycetota bacterium]
MLQYAVALVGGAWALWPGRRRGGQGIPPLALAFLWSTVAYVTVLSNAVEVGENTRFPLVHRAPRPPSSGRPGRRLGSRPDRFRPGLGAQKWLR